MRKVLPLAAAVTLVVLAAGTVASSARSPAGGPCQPVAEERQAWVECTLVRVRAAVRAAALRMG
jgi:hypothetical protein